MDLPFQQFQREFAHYLRAPHHRRRPASLAARPANVYADLVFSNLCSHLDVCFPVSRTLLGERWRRINRSFYRDWPLCSPLFRDIPREFVRYIIECAGTLRVARWLPELVHYEWVELAVDTMHQLAPAHIVNGDLMTGRPVLNPALMNLRYHWPVHRISSDNRPRHAEPTFLIVYRDATNQVRFVEGNATTARLLDLLANKMSGRAACLQIATELQHTDHESIVQFGITLLRAWHAQGIVLGVEI